MTKRSRFFGDQHKLDDELPEVKESLINLVTAYLARSSMATAVPSVPNDSHIFAFVERGSSLSSRPARLGRLFGPVRVDCCRLDRSAAPNRRPPMIAR